ncbi:MULTISPECIES: Rossmann-like and DUF2520 domain-containing protein [Chryseobacterium]|uniref:Short-subunit dehydrogenase-like oxidoreductase (DUF2520 family) n=1 Tax=Chryseobacterium camelliae TaxID=1265445 RepID=A0ABU0TME6_9FLAO|nr:MULTISPECIES: Rossmann-like and DUF2520 domain-containing protein [Chryseobacterium]MDT3407922.1 putative short-subunit dehydrogenase-like oxidoreductase (DUF2520 family) [Pseudacidovorax intermedius]MDQ1098217.1 putative short-subunit dehydrogenase-like oxidoreductase (DUF2520 family) [Chryseobacterium camelliae]MDQ1102148.1 putative short-subunit dehydrogenase-like oxidoreductase (DUF2520 family) [Chryseobacterium sp. SORGH_AS_1048]MDR6085586.1 putative short-subunit dehydrogenase-like oxi
MQIVIIGSGNVAFHLAKAFMLSQIPVAQIFGRNEQELKSISSALNIPFSTERLEKADLYLICVSDNAVEGVSDIIEEKNCLVAHTSGSLPKEILKGQYRKASFYPLQTFSKAKELKYSEIPFFIEAENAEDLTILSGLASRISGHVMESTYEKRKYIHLTAVFACNFVNHLFSRAKEISDSQEIPFDYFLPLIDETVQKIHSVEPKKAQTGPAVRNDRRILELHEELLQGESLEIYKTMNHSIQKMYEL